MEVSDAVGLIARAIDTGHAAHGYLICGDLRGGCDEVARQVLLKLFPDATDQIAARSHPDIVYLEPEGKKRIITVEAMRQHVVEPMASTSFSGGWKVGVITGADRMEAASANAFLKSLEEPPPKTLYLLLTDQPDAILPTIVSRTQRINLPLSEGVLEGEDYDFVADAFARRDAAALATRLGKLKEDADDADVALVRKAFFKTLMSFVRKLMLAGRLPPYQAFRNVEVVEAAYRRSERSMSDDSVLSYMIDQVAFP